MFAQSAVLGAGASPGTHNPDPDQLQLASVHAAVAELKTGRVLYSKDAQRGVPVASITKLMTAMVVLDSDAPMDEWLPIEKREKQPPINSYSRIRYGSQLQRKNLLRIMLMSSENLAAYTLANNYRGGMAAFVSAMNAKAKALHMQHARWVNPSGLSPQNRASAADLVKMVTAAAGYHEIREFTQTGYYTAAFRHPHYSLRYGNTDPLVHRSRWDIRLTKTGYLDVAGRCLAVVTVIDDKQVVMVMLNSFGRRSPLGDVGRIARWLRTGSGGSVARAARRYEQRKTQAYAAADRVADTYASRTASGRAPNATASNDAVSPQGVNLGLPAR